MPIDSLSVCDGAVLYGKHMVSRFLQQFTDVYSLVTWQEIAAMETSDLLEASHSMREG